MGQIGHIASTSKRRPDATQGTREAPGGPWEPPQGHGDPMGANKFLVTQQLGLAEIDYIIIMICGFRVYVGFWTCGAHA